MVDLFPVALLVLWLTPVYFIVVNYRSVVHRRRHMIDTLTRSPKGDGQYTPAQHYLNLFAPSWDGKENVEEFLKGEFDRLHGRFWRYCTSTGLLVIVSLIAIEILLDGIGIQILPLHQLVTFGNPELHPGKVPAVVPSLAGAYVASVIELYIRTRAGDLIREMFQRVAIDPHVTFLETLWYTGYLGNRVEPPRCSWHTEGPTLGGAGPQPRTPPGAPDPTFVPPEDQPS